MTNNESSIPGNAELIKTYLKDLNTNADLIIAAYNNNFDENEIPGNILERLKNQRIIIKTADSFRLNPMLTKLCSSVLQVEKRRYIDVGLKARLRTVQTLTSSYIDHTNKCEFDMADEAMESLEEVVFEIEYDTKDAVMSLSRRLQTKFGFVHSLRDKIAENKAAVETAAELVENIRSYTYDEMLRYVSQSGNDTKLYRLLCVELLNSMADRQKELNHILAQLRELMVVFRKQIMQTNLIKSFCEYYEKYNSYTPAAYDEMPSIPDIFRKCSPLISTGYADPIASCQDPELISIAQSIAAADPDLNSHNTLPASNGSKEAPLPKTEELSKAELEEELAIFFTAAIKNPQGMGAAKYFADTKELRDHLGGYTKVNNWIFAVSAYYDNMDPDKKKYIKCRMNIEPQYPNIDSKIGDFILKDICFSL